MRKTIEMNFDVTIDPTGFPMIWIQPLSFYVQWLPVTKIQLEYFVGNSDDVQFNESWYETTLKLNPRRSPGSIESNNYWQVFATGILPHEAQKFAKWCGEDYDLMTSKEWLATFHYLLQIAANTDFVQEVIATEGITKRTETLIQHLELILLEEFRQIGGLRSLAEQMLMRLGVMEFVYWDEQRNTFGGLGQVNNAFLGDFFTPMHRCPQRLKNPNEGARMKHYGFRLIRKS